MKLKTLKRNTTPAPSVLLKETLLNRIRTGYYSPGKRMDAIRKIAEEFKVSTLTAQKACKMLEQEGAIIPIPQSGLFVSESFLEKPAQQMRIVFVFPEVEISPRVLDLEGWGLISELNRGFHAGAQENGVRLDFLYIDESSPSHELLAYAAKIRAEYDFAVFSSWQLPLIQKDLAAADFPFFTLCDDPSSVLPGAMPFYYDHDKALEYLLELVKRIQAEKVMILSSSAAQDEFSKIRAEKFRELCRNIGCHAENIIAQTLDPNDNTTLKSLLKENKDAFIFCNNAYLIRNIYIAAMQNGQIPGHDFAIAAIASGVTFTGLIPSLTYVRVPMFELGLQVIRTACAIYQSGIKKKMDMEVVLPELIINESSTITKTKNKVKGVAS